MGSFGDAFSLWNKSNGLWIYSFSFSFAVVFPLSRISDNLYLQAPDLFSRILSHSVSVTALQLADIAIPVVFIR